MGTVDNFLVILTAGRAEKIMLLCMFSFLPFCAMLSHVPYLVTGETIKFWMKARTSLIFVH